MACDGCGLWVHAACEGLSPEEMLECAPPPAQPHPHRPRAPARTSLSAYAEGASRPIGSSVPKARIAAKRGEAAHPGPPAARQGGHRPHAAQPSPPERRAVPLL
eukprot:232080-Prymnesium_polylepis.1